MAQLNEYVKHLLVKVDVDKSDLNKIEDKFNNLELIKLISPDELENFRKDYIEVESRLLKIKKLKSSIKAIQFIGGDSAKKTLASLQDALKILEDEENKRKEKPQDSGKKQSFFKTLSKDVAKEWKKSLEQNGTIAENIVEGFNGIIDNISDYLKELVSLKEIAKNLDEMSSFNLESSQIINSEAREQAMKYGLSSSENYAFSKAKESMNIKSEEDLFYMNENQREHFAERMAFYTQKYNKMNDSNFFETWDQFRIELSEFKDDMKMEVAQFFVDNKEIIIKVMKTLMVFMESMLKLVGALVKFSGVEFHSDTMQQQRTAEIINQSRVNNSSSNTTNVKIDNTFNGVNDRDKSWLVNAGNMTYEQVIKALT